MFGVLGEEVLPVPLQKEPDLKPEFFRVLMASIRYLSRGMQMNGGV